MLDSITTTMKNAKRHREGVVDNGVQEHSLILLRLLPTYLVTVYALPFPQFSRLPARDLASLG